jgi:pimeloyl-ACP methyl ester carboxylesterase
MVMLHGLLVGNMTTWYWTAAPRFAAARRVILFDLRGHGRSDRVATGYDVVTMAGDLEDVLGALVRDEPADLVGHSYGAVVALTLALRRPELVRKLAVVEAPLPPSRLEELDDFLGRTPDAMAEALPGVLRDALGLDGRRGRRLLESLRFLVQDSSLLSDLRRAEDIPDDLLAKLSRPLLAVYGTESSCRRAGRRLADHVPGARYVEMPGGHFLPLERPGPLTEQLAEFFDA